MGSHRLLAELRSKSIMVNRSFAIRAKKMSTTVVARACDANCVAWALLAATADW